jgi:hypothetical protein
MKGIFYDILIHSEESLKEVWDNKEDCIWENYLIETFI